MWYYGRCRPGDPIDKETECAPDSFWCILMPLVACRWLWVGLLRGLMGRLYYLERNVTEPASH
jgi:hypothetical protein